MMKPISSLMPRQSGTSLIELMVAIIIGMFITLSLSQIFVSMWASSTSQNSLAQFQDNERLGLVMLSNTIQQAGYYSNPVTNTAVSALPAYTATAGDLVSMAAGVGVGGTSASTNGTSNDTVDIAYQTSGSDGLINCQGQTSSTSTVFVNSFSINSSNQLVCSMDGGVTFLTLASNVASMTIVYGVDSQHLGTTDSYIAASAMTASLWPWVRSVQITITFTNPLYNSKTIPWVQSINIMSVS